MAIICVAFLTGMFMGAAAAGVIIAALVISRDGEE